MQEKPNNDIILSAVHPSLPKDAAAKAQGLQSRAHMPPLNVGALRGPPATDP
jgi:hypothetical protein